jgi:uncharacterized membrane protein HdeD (DUF308 family)
MSLMFFDKAHLPELTKNWRQFLFLGITLVVLGVIAISAASSATVISVILLGSLLFFAGLVVMFDTLTFWRNKKTNGFLLHLLLSILYLCVGVMLMFNPVQSSLSITFLLGLFYIIVGVFRIGLASSIKIAGWSWAWMNGVITLIIGILILISWPASGLFIIGLFIGIDLLFYGLTYITLALAARDL